MVQIASQTRGSQGEKQAKRGQAGEKGTDLFYGVWGHLNNLTTGGWKGDGLFQPFRNSIRKKRSGTKDENEMQSAPECSMTVYRTIRQKFNDPGIDTLPVSGSLCCEALM